MNALLLLIGIAFVSGWRSAAPGRRPKMVVLLVASTVIGASFYRLGVI